MAQAHVTWEGPPLPSPRVCMRLPSLSVLTHPQKGLAHQARSSVEFWFACHIGKTKEKTTSSEERNAGQDTLDKTELTRCDLRYFPLSAAASFLSRIQFHVLLPNSE